MRSFLVAVALVPLLGGAPAHHVQPIDPCPHTFTAAGFAPFSQAVWDQKRWRRGQPSEGTIAAERERLRCAAGRGHRAAMRKRWRADQAAYFAHRRDELWRVRVTPFFGGGRWWAIPYPMVVCESGANYHHNAAGYLPYGAYSILDPAWRAWGGKTAHAGEASKREQDRVAHHGWGLYGESAWECKGDGSTSWP